MKPVTNPLPLLPMHLTQSMGTLHSWPFAMQLANAESLPLKNSLKQKLNDPKLHQALQNHARNESKALCDAIKRYIDTPHIRTLIEPPCIWQQGSARLLDYGQLEGPECDQLMLFVPSLINRYTILYLNEQRSMMRFLRSQGVYPIVLDWGTPSNNQQHDNISDNITNILLPAIDHIHDMSGEAVSLGGYCMGGILALAAAQLRPLKIDRLALFATPWNFHCDTFKPLILDDDYQGILAELIDSQDMIAAEMIQALFYVTDPFVFEEKFKRFATMKEGSPAARDFIAREHWVNDGVPMTRGVAQDCLVYWAQQNQLAKNKWKVANRIIRPEKISQPTFIAIPKQDHVVPHDCAWPLAELIPHAHVIHPNAGHVGMIAGGRAKRECWNPLLEWLQF